MVKQQYISKKGFRAFARENPYYNKGMSKNDLENYLRHIITQKTEAAKKDNRRVIMQNAHMKVDSALPFGIEFYSEEGKRMFDEALKAECKRLYPNQNFENEKEV